MNGCRRSFGVHTQLLLTALVVAASLAAAVSGCNNDRPSGKVVYSSVCANCHGPQGGGGVVTNPNSPAPRNFRDAAYQRSRSDADIVKVIREGKSPGMPSFGGTYNDAQIKELVGIVRGFDPEKK